MYDLHPAFTVSPVPKSVGDRVVFKYHGMLAESGADQIWLHTGYNVWHHPGSGTGQWENVYDYKMSKVGDEWEATVEIVREGQFNFCFKDSANNWDNNNGLNWSYRVSN